MLNLMKKLSVVFAILLALATTLTLAHKSSAALLGAPYSPEIDARFNAIEVGSPFNVFNPGYAGNYPGIATGVGVNGTFGDYIAKQIINMTGVAIGTTSLTAIPIPANAMITQAFFRVNTAYGPSGTTVAFQCLTTGDIFAATDKTGSAAGTIVSGIETGVATAILDVPNGCTPAMVTAVHPATSGQLELFINYFLK
jgi:hypothetical protein